MTLAIHAPTWTQRNRAEFGAGRSRVGDEVAELAKRYAAEMNASAFAIALRRHHLPRRSYIAFIAAMSPRVGGCNCALPRSIANGGYGWRAKFDPTSAQS